MRSLMMVSSEDLETHAGHLLSSRAEEFHACELIHVNALPNLRATITQQPAREAMDIYIFGSVVGAAVLLAILISFYILYQHSRRTRRRLVMEGLDGYFQSDVPADQLGKRMRELAGRHFMRGAELYSLVIAAFQSAVDARLGHKTLSEQDEKKLLSLLAALKKEFGLTDFYRIKASD